MTEKEKVKTNFHNKNRQLINYYYHQYNIIQPTRKVFEIATPPPKGGSVTEPPLNPNPISSVDVLCIPSPIQFHRLWSLDPKHERHGCLQADPADGPIYSARSRREGQWDLRFCWRSTWFLIFFVSVPVVLIVIGFCFFGMGCDGFRN